MIVRCAEGRKQEIHKRDQKYLGQKKSNSFFSIISGSGGTLLQANRDIVLFLVKGLAYSAEIELVNV